VVIVLHAPPRFAVQVHLEGEVRVEVGVEVAAEG
jgi:hypothetical protein